MKLSPRTGIVALIATAFCTAHSWAARAERARLTLAENKVSIAGQPGRTGTKVASGETIVTGSRSRAELTLADGTVVRIGQGSSFTFTGSKLVLNQGSALVRVAHKNTTMTAGSRTYTGGPAVVSAQASKNSDGLFVLQGTGKVNGTPLIAGQTSVLEKGKERTFTFDLQKLEGSSALVTKFPQTPWIVQAEALATVQHQLLAAKITAGAQSGKGAQLVAGGGNASRGASQDIVSSSPAKQISSGAGGKSVAFQFTGSPVSLGANATAYIKSAANSPTANGSNLQVSGSVVFTRAGAGTLALANNVTLSGTIQAGSLTKIGAGTLDLNGATRNTGGTLVVNGNSGAVTTIASAANFVLNAGVSSATLAAGTGTINLLGSPAGTAGGGITTVATTAVNTNAGAVTLAGITNAGGTLNLTGANTYTGATTVNAGTLTVSNGTAIPGNLNLNGSGTLTFAGGNTVGGLVHGGTILNVNGVQTTVVAGQTLTIGGVNYIATPVAGGGVSPGTLNLQVVPH